MEADIQSVLLLKQSALNYTAILPNTNLGGKKFELTVKYEFSRNSLQGRTLKSEKAFCSSCKVPSIIYHSQQNLQLF